MLANLITAHLAIRSDAVSVILVFFTYSLMGYLLECAVLSAEHRRLVIDRGFVQHLPFCIIYGFGALIGYAILSPFQHNKMLLFIIGAIAATVFEYCVARLQIRLFGDFWWDYTQKPFNYKGILCLESTIGWGFAALLIVLVLHKIVVRFVSIIPAMLATPLAVLLAAAYMADFCLSAYKAKMKKHEEMSSTMEKLPLGRTNYTPHE